MVILENLGDYEVEMVIWHCNSLSESGVNAKYLHHE